MSYFGWTVTVIILAVIALMYVASVNCVNVFNSTFCSVVVH